MFALRFKQFKEIVASERQWEFMWKKNCLKGSHSHEFARCPLSKTLKTYGKKETSLFENKPESLALILAPAYCENLKRSYKNGWLVAEAYFWRPCTAKLPPVVYMLDQLLNSWAAVVTCGELNGTIFEFEAWPGDFLWELFVVHLILYINVVLGNKSYFVDKFPAQYIARVQTCGYEGNII